MVIGLFPTYELFSQEAFQKSLIGSGDDFCYSMQQTMDGGYVLTGYTNSFGVGGDVFLIKLDNLGDTLWTKTFGGNGSDYGYSVQETSDSGFVVAGSTNSFGAGGVDFYVIRTNKNGSLLWSKTYGGNNVDIAWSIKQTTDGGFIIGGYTQSYGVGSYDFYLIKTDNNGSALWTRVFGGSGIDIGECVLQTSDGGYIIAGESSSYGAGGYDFSLIRLNPIGDTLWTKTYGGSGADIVYSIQQSSDGGYIMTGRTNSFGAGGMDVYLVKVDSIGDLIWSKTYGGANDDVGYSVCCTTDNGYIISGKTKSFGAGGDDLYLIKVDSIGDILWTKALGGANDDVGYSVQQTTDGEYVIGGSTFSFNGSSRDIYINKTKNNGNANSNCNQQNINTLVGFSSTIVGSGTLMGLGLIENNPITNINNASFTINLTDIKVNFLASDTIICSGETINLTNQSEGTNVYEWIYDNNLFSTAQDTTIEVDISGTFILTLIAGNGVCTDSAMINILVNPLPVVTSSGLDSTFCLNSPPIALSGTPFGGVFSGVGITGNVFDPPIIGQYNIYYIYSDGNGCTNYSVQPTTVLVCGVGIEELSLDVISIYPNPSSGRFILEMDIIKQENYEVRIINMIGEEVFSEILNNHKGVYKREIDIKKSGTGVYLLQLKTSNGLESKRIVID